jgi:hypothetical protein
MKKQELRQIIKEEIQKILSERVMKINNFTYKTSKERPKKDDWVLKFKQVNQLDFKLGDLKKKNYEYFPVKVPLESFLNPEDLKIIATNDPKLIKDGIPILTMNESQSITYKSKTYYIEDTEGKQKIFAYSDPELKQVAKINGKTLMFNTKDIKDMLIKENYGYDM